MLTPSAPMGAWATRALKVSISSSSSSRTAVVAFVRFMVQINGNQPPLEEQNVATVVSGLIFGCSA
ncbi:hypothetical protein D3C84_1314550 [compost metagenome]